MRVRANGIVPVMLTPITKDDHIDRAGFEEIEASRATEN